MTEQNPIIDVTPIRHSSSRIHAEQTRRAGYANASGARQRDCNREPSSARRATDQSYSRGSASEGARGWSPSSALAGLAQMAAGAGLVAIGIPMLILPGPGLLSIGAGIILAARGLAKVTGR